MHPVGDFAVGHQPLNKTQANAGILGESHKERRLLYRIALVLIAQGKRGSQWMLAVFSLSHQAPLLFFTLRTTMPTFIETE